MRAAIVCGVVAAVATLADDDPRQPPCRDDPSFADVVGCPCSAWRRFDCAADTLAYSAVSYTAYLNFGGSEENRLKATLRGFKQIGALAP